MFGVMAFVFPSNCYMCDGALLSWGWLSTCLAHGKR